MLPRVGKEFVVRMRFNWRPFFEGRTLLLTNTLSGGVILGLGDIVMQSWEKFKKPGQVRDNLLYETFCDAAEALDKSTAEVSPGGVASIGQSGQAAWELIFLGHNMDVCAYPGV